jgi:hypothetical protein
MSEKSTKPPATAILIDGTVLLLVVPELLGLLELLHAADAAMHPTAAARAAQRRHFALIRRVIIDDHPFLFK